MTAPMSTTRLPNGNGATMTQAPTPTADTVRRLVRSLLKDGDKGSTDGKDGKEPKQGTGSAAGPEVRPATEGADPATWWVGTRHVLRLAPEREATVRQRRELRLRDLVRPHVPVAVPVSVAHGEWAPGLTYTLDTKVPGGSGEEHDVSAVGEADLAGLLSGLREVPVRQAETLGVPRAAPRSLEALRRAAVRAAERLADADEFDAARLNQLTAPAAAQLAAQSGSAVLTHHALTGAISWSAPTDGCAAFSAWAGAVAATRRGHRGPRARRRLTRRRTRRHPRRLRRRPCLRGLWPARCDTVVHLADALTSRTRAGSPRCVRSCAGPGSRSCWNA
ncbi:hypothetical protein STAFG_1704 [Streptomyces afghaniensis 772]|uniref:Aminoglycoside phosphotransferase domain-containing protein n=1 Tax=Streptomyces afghaniensis 772 TaxID=1283301 RepID=S4N2E8_9ACTN|nr:hypothetical protein STAFG_1704 [Streptomyces afghaniensis 772]